MMLAAKPISSPGRSDKFPPPLMRFLRSNVGNKSRASRRKKPNTNSTSAAAASASVEPSSPKVTCMGQVRVRRGTTVSSRPGKARRAGAPARKERFRWMQHDSFCSDFPGRIKPKSSCGELWRKWVPFFQGGSCSKAQIELQVSPENMGTRESLGFCSDQEEEGFQRKEKAFGFVDASCSPPKNALLLTRCRSAPYRSSSLACRFWGSPNRAEEKTEEEEEEKQSKTEQEEQESIENLRPESERESILHEESKTEKINEEKTEIFKGLLEDSSNKRVAKSAASIEDLKNQEEFRSEWPLILTRCTSEPARRTTAEKLNPDSFIHSHQVFVIN